MAIPLWIADATTADMNSNRGDCSYLGAPFGVAVPCPSIIVNGAPLMIIPDGTPGVPVPGAGALICVPVARTAKVTTNGGKGFVEIEGMKPCLAKGILGSGGDVATTDPATSPKDRPLTGPVTHTRIVVGSGGTYVPPDITE